MGIVDLCLRVEPDEERHYRAVEEAEEAERIKMDAELLQVIAAALHSIGE